MAEPLLNKNLLLRVISAVVLIPLVVAAVWVGGPVYMGMVGLAGAVMIWEWLRLTEMRPAWAAFGAIYVGGPIWALVILRQLDYGEYWVLLAFLIVWATDVGAYFAGRIIGGPKLAKAISPKKTWAGAVGGVILALAVAYAFDGLAGQYGFAGVGLLAAAVASIASQIGDLCESAIKRHFGKKDSGTLIPGHGGLLDRLDGLVFAAPVVALWVLLGHQ